MAIDRAAAERAVESLLSALGHDAVDNPELVGTAARAVEALADDLLRGHQVDVARLLSAGELLAEAPPGIVVVKDVSVASVCPHHLLPAHGRATLAYLPGQRLLGIGTLAELVDALARRLTLQESIGQNVVAALMEHGGARGAFCRLSLVHTCLCARGPRQAAAVVHSTAAAGALAGPDAAAELVLALDERGAA